MQCDIVQVFIPRFRSNFPQLRIVNETPHTRRFKFFRMRSFGITGLITIILTISLWKNGRAKLWESGLRQKYDGYGKDWIFMPDGNEQPQVAVLRVDDDATVDVLDGSKISYILYTRSGPENGTRLFSNNVDVLSKSDFKSLRKTKLITHGWKSSATSSGPTMLKDAYLKHGDYNIILVDWEPLAASTFYLGPMQNTKRVGKATAQFLDFLIRETNIKPRNFHFIGHSLGAHVAGNTGSSMTTGKLGRVTGLDPAMPGFHIFTTEKTRLDPTDAEYVDVIHSCGGVLGFLQPLGKIDFYPNAGTAIQPGCCCAAEVMEACSHGRSYVYFTESINSPRGFLSTKCNSYDNYMIGNCANSEKVHMGEYVDQSATGSYFLKTSSSSPYGYLSDETNENDIE